MITETVTPIDTPTIPGDEEPTVTETFVSTVEPIKVTGIQIEHPIAVGGSQDVTFTLNRPVESQTWIFFSSTNASIVATYWYDQLQAGESSGTVSLTGQALGTAEIVANVNGNEYRQAVTVVEPYPVALQAWYGTNLTIGQTHGFNVTLAGPMPTGTEIQLTSSNPAVLAVPSVVTVDSWPTGVQFMADALSLGTTTLTATLGSMSVTLEVAVVGIHVTTIYQLGAAAPGANAGAVLYLTGQAPDGGLSVSLSSSNPAVVSVPETVDVAQGSSSGWFTWHAVGLGEATITATVNGIATTSAAFAVVPLRVEEIGGAPELVINSGWQLGVRLNGPAPDGGIDVPWTISGVTADPTSGTIHIGEGEYSGYQMLTPTSLGTAELSATYGGVTRTRSYPVVPISLTNLWLWGSLPNYGGGPDVTTVGAWTRGSVGFNGYPQDSTVTINLSSSDPSIASVPASFEAGGSIYQFPIHAWRPGTVVITAEMDGVEFEKTLTVYQIELLQPPYTWTRLVGETANQWVYFRTNLNPDQAFTVTSSAPTVVSVPATLLPGYTSSGALEIPLTGVSPGTATITVSIGTFSTSFDVTVENPGLNYITDFSSYPVGVGSQQTLAVLSNITAPPGGILVSLSTAGTGEIALDASTIVIPEGTTYGEMYFRAIAPGDVTITATDGTNTVSTVVHVQPPTLQSVHSVMSSPPGPGGTMYLGLTFNGPVAAGTTAMVTSSNQAVVADPGTVEISAGSQNSGFSFLVGGVGSATITITVGGVTKSVEVEVVPLAIRQVGYVYALVLDCTSSSYLSLNGPAPVGGLDLIVTSSDHTVLDDIPVHVDEGAEGAYFSMRPKALGTVTYSATLNGVSDSQTKVVQPNQLNSAYLIGNVDWYDVVGRTTVGGQTNLYFGMNGWPETSTVTIWFTSSDPTIATVPATIDYSYGDQNWVPVTALKPGTVTITASLNGSAQDVSLTVVPLTMDPIYTGLPLIPGQVQTGTISVSAVMAAPLVVTLSSSNESVLRVPATVTIPAGSHWVYFQIDVVTNGGAQLTASAGDAQRTIDLSVSYTGLSHLEDWSEVQFAVGQSSQIITYLFGTAEPGGRSLWISQSGSGWVQIPSQIVVPEGESQVHIPVTGITQGTVVVTVTDGVRTASTTVHVVPAYLIQANFGQGPAVVGTQFYIWLALAGIAESGNTPIVVTSSNPAVVAPIDPVVVPAGESGAFESLTGGSPGNTTLTFTQGDIEIHVDIEVVPLAVKLIWTSGPPSTMADVYMGIMLNGTAPPAGVDVALTSSDTSVLPNPGIVHVNGGEQVGYAMIVSGQAGVTTIGASVEGIEFSYEVTVEPLRIVSIDASTYIDNELHPSVAQYPGVAFVRPWFNSFPLRGEVLVSVSSSNPEVIAAPASYVLPEGERFIPLTTTGTGSATITVSINGTSQSVEIEVTPNAFRGIEHYSAITIGQPATVILRFSSALEVDTPISVASSNESVATIAVQPTVYAPWDSVYLDLNIVGEGSTVITVTLNGIEYTATYTVPPPP